MRKFFLSALLFAGIGVSMISCNNGDYTATPSGGTNWNPGGGGGSTGAGNMAAKINGTQWNSSNGVCTSQSGSILIGGSNSAGNAVISIMVFSYTGPGTYTLGGGTAITYLAGSSPTMITSGGQVVISTDQNNNVQGTFSASGNGVTIDNGTFNVNKQ